MGDLTFIKSNAPLLGSNNWSNDPSSTQSRYMFDTYGFVPAIQNERALAFVGIQLILCRYKSCSYNCTSSLVKRMFLYPVRYRLGMMLRTYRECAKVVTSFELQNTPIGGGHKLLYD